MTIMREGREVTAETFSEYFASAMLWRIFYGPMQVALWHVHYAQTVGFIGVGGISKIATLFGATPIDVPNLIGRRYFEGAIETINANACFVLSYYSYFGLLSLPFSVLGLVLLDLAIPAFSYLSDTVLLGCVAATLCGAVNFGSADYTSVFLTNGFATSIIVALLIDFITRRSGTVTSRLRPRLTRSPT
jgi:hypothetical protein